ncbi:retrovirus-related Pol polyprotein from transposon TNT 1-94 [Trichonephila clavipes]|nr:retrovirus-related Pol polyprotein from transposon TNT 1-94 [Trichonephila clavipes]
MAVQSHAVRALQCASYFRAPDGDRAKGKKSIIWDIISAEGFRTDPEKVSAVKNWKRPENLRELRSFLGLCTYYRKFVKGFSNIARPLHRLTEKDKPEDLTRKDEMDWITKNSDAIAYIKLSLADEQALQFAAEDNAKVLWDKIRATYMGEGEDRKIDAGNELKNIRMKNGETVADYIARARDFD